MDALEQVAGLAIALAALAAFALMIWAGQHQS
jgi:hypothetical protein